MSTRRAGAPLLYALVVASSACAGERAETPLEAYARAGLSPRVVHVREVAVLEVEGGDEVVLEKRGATWAVARGPASAEAADTPERALDTFFRAVAAGRLDVVRRLIPARFLDGYGADAALRAHLEAEAPRIAAAQRGLASGKDRAVELLGLHARVRYGEGLGATLEREGDVWKIVDLE